MRGPLAVVAMLIAGAIDARTTTSGVRFTDVTESSGIAFRHAASKTSVKFLPETMGSGVAIFDADGDGRLDLFFTNGATTSADTTSARPPDKREPRYWNRLYRNLGGWKFRDVTERSGLAGTRYDFGAAIADYDNDGDTDLHVTGFGGNTLFRNNGSGTFTDVTKPAGAAVPGWSSSAAFVDYDHDGSKEGYASRRTHMEKDVVCGMQVDPAKAAGTSQYKGKTYYFCSKGCKAKFDANPGQFAK